MSYISVLFATVLFVASVEMCEKHHFKEGQIFCLKPVLCRRGTEPVLNISGVDCKRCKEGYFTAVDSWSHETQMCERHRDCPAPELKEHEPGTSQTDRVCRCNTEEGYVPVNVSKQYGQRTKIECVYLHTTAHNQTGLESSAQPLVEHQQNLSLFTAVTVSVAVLVLVLGVAVAIIIMRQKYKNWKSAYNVCDGERQQSSS